jgi:hypothetical protein
MAALERSERRTYCPYKGECTYYSISADGTHADDIVWSYETPTPRRRRHQGSSGVLCRPRRHDRGLRHGFAPGENVSATRSSRPRLLRASAKAPSGARSTNDVAGLFQVGHANRRRAAELGMVGQHPTPATGPWPASGPGSRRPRARNPSATDGWKSPPPPRRRSPRNRSTASHWYRPMRAPSPAIISPPSMRTRGRCDRPAGWPPGCRWGDDGQAARIARASTSPWMVVPESRMTEAHRAPGRRRPGDRPLALHVDRHPVPRRPARRYRATARRRGS